MRPILLNIPAKLLFVAALVLAVAGVVRDLIRRRRDPTLPLSSTPLYLLIGAEILVKLKTGSLILSLAALQQPWTPVPIYSYGVMLGTSLMVGWLLAMRLAKQDGIGQEAAASIYMWSAIWSIIGSRVLWWITTPNVELKEIIFINRGGLVAYGGMIGGFLASWYGCRKRGIPLLRWADVAAPSVVLGTAITRMGCLLFGCDFGRRSDVPWAISFPKGSPAWNHHVEDFRLARDAAWSYPVHPTQVYESLVGLSLFALLMLLRRYRRFSGQVFLGWVFGYGVLRSIIEIYRDDDDRGLYTLPFTHVSLSTSQIIGIVSVVLGSLLLVSLRRRYQRDPAAIRLWEQPAVAGGAPEEAASSSKSAPKRRKRR
jgi:phosphatidylglycerol:prolipoprotein diacylglycerol transferase